MSRRHWSYLLLIGIAAAFLIAGGCANAQDALKRVPMTAEDLSKFGIYLRFADPEYHGSETFYKKRVAGPDKCYYETWRVLAVADPLLKHFEERGFSLRTLCLALQSSLRYDPGTGKPLPRAVAARRSKGSNSLVAIKDGEILLNVPDCFRNGTPDVDCPHNYNAIFGTKEDTPEEASRQRAREEDVKLRDFIRKGGYARECGCGDLRYDKKIRYLFSLPDDCHLDVLPKCARQLVKDPDPVGRLVMENPSPLIVGLGLSSTYAAGVEISASLPHGYGGSLGAEGGDVEAEDVSLETLSKESGSIAPWSR